MIGEAPMCYLGRCQCIKWSVVRVCLQGVEEDAREERPAEDATEERREDPGGGIVIVRDRPLLRDGCPEDPSGGIVIVRDFLLLRDGWPASLSGSDSASQSVSPAVFESRFLCCIFEGWSLPRRF